MKVKKCPYCGKRISYASVFSSRRKAEYVCERCGKESRVVINRQIIIAFILCALIAVAIMVAWIFWGLSNNPFGVLLVAVPLIIFTMISTKFLRFEPLKKYKKSMEARKAGIEYSDNLMVSELEENEAPASSSFENSGQFQLNTDVFNKIKAERTAAREKLKNGELVSDSNKIDKPKETKKEYVHVINNVSENHSYTDTPLKKIHSENSHTVRRTRHYIPVQEDDSDVKEYKKSDGNKYSANRRF